MKILKFFVITIIAFVMAIGVIVGFIFLPNFLMEMLMNLGEHGYSEEGQIYTMYNVEVLKELRLMPKPQTLHYDFVAKRTSKRLSIKFHFNQLKLYNDVIFSNDDPEAKKIKGLVDGTHIILYDMTSNKKLYDSIVNTKDYLGMYIPAITLWLASEIETKKNHKYRIILKLPASQESDSRYNFFLLVVGNVSSPGP